MGIEVRVEVLAFRFAGVLIRVGSLVLEHLDEFVKSRGEERAKDGSNPINPMITVELMGDD